MEKKKLKLDDDEIEIIAEEDRDIIDDLDNTMDLIEVVEQIDGQKEN